VNFSSRVSGLGLAAEPDAGIQAYPAPLSQTFTAVDFDMQVTSIQFYYPVPYTSRMGYCFRLISLFICIFVCFFVSKITRKRLDRLHEIFREVVE